VLRALLSRGLSSALAREAGPGRVLGSPGLELYPWWLDGPALILLVPIKTSVLSARVTTALRLQVSIPPSRWQGRSLAGAAAATRPFFPNHALSSARSCPISASSICIFSLLLLFCLQSARRVSLFIRSF
jgi:hypothetical protein